ncbi:hypothetical protein QJQ45_006142 [Haematococcus lacustris]|nr:hypothetical protein QJQ45_006142 [Haematococcus lacustris]
MNNQQSVSRGAVDGVAACTPPSATSLLDLPAALLDDISRRAGATALARTSRAFKDANLWHASTFRVHANRQRCEQLVTARVVAALRARTSRFTIFVQQQQDSEQSNNESLAHILAKLGSCAAVEACKLGNSRVHCRDSLMVMDCASGLAQGLLDSFPALTALSLHGYAINCSSLASLLSQPQLSLQLQQLDLTGTAITHLQQPQFPAVALANPFNGLRLKQLSLGVNYDTGTANVLLPDLQPLAQHLTHLHLWQCDGHRMDLVTPRLIPLVQLQVLTVSNLFDVDGLPHLLQALPQLHTLQLPDTVVKEQHLDDLMAATQLTRLQLDSLQELSSSRADAACSWQQLELTGSLNYTSITCLPLHALTQPLVVGRLEVSVYGVCPVVPAAVRNLALTCKAPIRFNRLLLDMSGSYEAGAADAAAAQQRRKLMGLARLLQVLQNCCVDMVSVRNLKDVTAADIAALAPLCRDCIHLVFVCGSIKPSLKFWHQLVLLMPTVQQVTFHYCGAATRGMHKSMQCMAEQPWARWLDITIAQDASQLPACWKTDSLTEIGKFRVCIE